MFRRAVLASLGVIGLTAAAGAADMYVPGPAGPGGYKDTWYPSWAGLYAGVHVGGAWGTDYGTVIDGNPVDTTHPFTLDTSGVFGGGQLGYNLQRGNIVFGIEADFGDMDLSAKAFNKNIVNVISFQTTTSGGFYGDVTGRLGYSFGPALLYAKGGSAWFEGDAKVHSVFGGPFQEPAASSFTGWTGGGGLEYALSRAWSVKTEYLYFGFGTARSAIIDIPSANHECCSFDHHPTADTVKLGVNYHFLPSYQPLK